MCPVGTGVPHALGRYAQQQQAGAGAARCPDVRPSELTRATSFNEFCAEGLDSTRVPHALHFHEAAYVRSSTAAAAQH